MGAASASGVSPLLDLIFETPHVAYCLLAPDGAVLRVNRAWLRFTGLTLGVLGADYVELLRASGGALPALLARARSGHHVDVPSQATRGGEGSTRWDETIDAIPMENGTGLLVSAREADETGWRRADQVLRESNARFRAMFERASDAILVTDPEGAGRILMANPAACRLFGYAEDELLRLDRAGLLDTASPELRVLVEARDATGHGAGELVYRRKDGSTFVGELATAHFGDRAGQRQAIAIIRDVTERNRIERSLREEERKYRALFENSLDAVYLARADGTILDANGAACRMHGLTVEEIRQRGRAGLVVNDERHAAALARRAATGQVTAEMTDRRKDGTLFPVEVQSVLVDPAQADGLAFVIARDITERKRAEQALRESEERLRALADSMPQLAWTAQPDGYITWYNRRWHEYTGTTLEQMQGWGWQAVHDPQSLPEVLRRWKESLATGTALEVELQLRRADGVFRRFLTRVFPVKDEAGIVVQWFGTNTDVTDIVDARESLREADRRKDEFLAVLSHELRNPLAPIRNSIALLERADPGSDRAARAHKVLRRQTDHIARLVDDLLDVTRIGRGKFALQKARLDLREVVEKTADDLSSLFEAGGLVLRVEHPAVPVWVEADPTRIAQVLGNLLQNAAKFTRPGGSVQVVLRAERGHAVVAVRDNGIGIEPNQVEHMFEPFAQGDQGVARTRGGLGLGLALARGIVELHGGAVSARSEGVGQGAEFVVSLPLAALDAASSRAPDIEAVAARRSILVIEDNVDAAETLSELLALDGHLVSIAADARSGLALAREKMPEVILCDIGLPDMSGYEVARVLRQELGERDVLLVALTGYARPEDRQRALEAGFDVHLPKPPPLPELAALLRRTDRPGVWTRSAGQWETEAKPPG